MNTTETVFQKYSQDGLPLRMAKPDDAKAILSIYAPYIEKTSITFEYDLPSLEEFRGRIIHTLERFPYIVAETKSSSGVFSIIGYAYVSPFKSRAAYDWAVETSIYVAEGMHGKGTGKTLYMALEEILKAQNIENVNACITYPNPDSIRFHEALGYKTVAHFTKCGYKFGQWYDMIWMEKMLGDHPDNPGTVIPITVLK